MYKDKVNVEPGVTTGQEETRPLTLTECGTYVSAEEM